MLKRFVTLILIGSCLVLTGCDNTAVYGGVSVGSSWGGYNTSHSNMRVNVSVSGRIR
ncbi:hypothetical protein [Teredinibacter franksiae]|uniref:hypothetical protein n=1 Tax=Teredinibacter franksiae TaxID=2761453 RepID=UPI0016252BAA|nr:hypothetical protein [Teredinibacter franksiae]